MQTDKELLELAAKAACIQIGRYAELIDDYYSEWNGQSAYELTTGGYWNPLIDGGDALRLSFVLKIDIRHVGNSVQAVARGSDGLLIEVCDIGRVAGDAGLRRIIVMTAAAIGRAMP